MSTLQYEDLDDALAKKLEPHYSKGYLIEINPGNVLLPPKYREIGQRIKDFKVRPDDVWVVSYPRTGSTWIQEIVWCILNKLDFEAASSVPGILRYPVIEFNAIEGVQNESQKGVFGNLIDVAENMKSPRCIKTHLPIPLLPNEMFTVRPKVIYMSRNPKDICVSQYHMQLITKEIMGQDNFQGTFEEFADLFLGRKVIYGSYWDHALGFWNLRHDDNVLFMKYEELRKDFRSGILRVAKFLEKELSEDEVNKLMDFHSFQKMRKNPAVNFERIIKHRNGPDYEPKGDEYFRKGKIGDWKNYMSQELANRFDNRSTEMFEGAGLSFTSED